MRRLLIWGGVIVVPIALALAAFAIAWWIRADLTADLVKSQIDRLGLPASFRAPIEVEFGEIVLHDLRVGEGPPEAASDLAIRRTEVHFDWAQLAESRVAELLLVGLEVRAEINEAGELSLGSLDALRGGEEEAAPEAPVLPVERIRLDQARAELIAPSGVLVLEMEGHVEQLDTGAIRAEATVLGRHPLGAGRAELEAGGTLNRWEASGRLLPERLPEGFSVERSTELQFEAAGEGDQLSLIVAAPDGSWAASDLEVRATGIAAQARRTESEISAEIQVEELGDAASETRFSPLKVQLGIDGAATLDSLLAVSLKANGRGTSLVVTGAGTLDPQTLAARMQLKMASLKFLPGGLQPSDLLPLLGSLAQEVDGTVGFRGRVRRTASGAISASGKLQLDELSFETNLARVEELQGELDVRGPEPLRTAADQELKASVIHIGVPLTNNEIEFQVLSPQHVALKRAAFGFASGRLEIKDADLDLEQERNELTVQAKGIDLAQVLDLVELEGLSGAGNLDGRLPIVVEGETIRVVDGRLSSDGAGRITYSPATAVDAMASGQDQLALALEILEDFSYDSLSINVDGDTQGVMNLAFRIRGRNPDFENGREVAFNLNLEAHLSDLVRSGRAAYRVPEEIEKRIQRKEAQ